MLQYFIYFLIGGTVVTVVAYIGSRSNGFLAALVASPANIVSFERAFDVP